MFHSVEPISPPSLHTTSRWSGNDSAGISAWAADIPYGPPADSSVSSLTSNNIYRPSKLISRHHRIVPPTLCTNTPQAIPPLPPPSSPLRTPKPKPYHPNAQHSDTSRISLKSAVTESSLATPASSHSMLISTSPHPLSIGGIYSHVRSWVMPPTTSLVPCKRATSPAKLKSLKVTAPAHSPRVLPVKVVSPPDTSYGFLDEGAVHWKASTVLLDQSNIKRAPEHQHLRGYRLPHEFPPPADQDSSFRARGRKASRAVA